MNGYQKRNLPHYAGHSAISLRKTPPTRRQALQKNARRRPIPPHAPIRAGISHEGTSRLRIQHGEKLSSQHHRLGRRDTRIQDGTFRLPGKKALMCEEGTPRTIPYTGTKGTFFSWQTLRLLCGLRLQPRRIKRHRARSGSSGATAPGSVCSLHIFPANPVNPFLTAKVAKGCARDAKKKRPVFYPFPIQ